MAIADFNETRATIVRSILATQGFATEGESDTSFEVVFVDNTRLSVGVTDGVVSVARVMPSGNVTGQVVFTNMSTSVIAAAILAMATEMGA